MNITKKLATVTVALGMASCGLIVGAGEASAATAYNGACGSGYSVIDSMKVGGTGTEGVTYLTYNSSNGYNCAATMTNTPSDTDTDWIEAEIEVSGGSWNTNAGWFKKYAGPVYVYGKGHCIDWGGTVSGVKATSTEIQWNDHCG